MDTYFYLLYAVVLAVFIAGYFISPEGTVGKGVSFALIIFLISTFLAALTLVLVNDFFGIIVAIGIVGAFLGYAAMRNSGKNGGDGNEKDKK